MQTHPLHWKRPFWANRSVRFHFALLLALFGLLYSCASQPKEEPIAQEESDEELNRLKDMEEKAKGAIARAEAAGAAELSPKLLDSAYLNLREGQDKDPKSEGDAQREQYLAAIEKANQAYDDALQKSRSRWLGIIDKYEANLDQLSAGLYMPAYDQRSRELLQRLRDTIAAGDDEASLALYQSTIPNVAALVEALADNLDWLDQLRQEVTGLLGEASRQDLGSQAAKLEAQGRKSYNIAMSYRMRGDMQNMEQNLFEARRYLRTALRDSGALDLEGIDALMRKIQKDIEAASRRKVFDSEGVEIAITPWDGNSYLEQNPLADLRDADIENMSRKPDESQLKRPQVSADFLPSSASLQSADTHLVRSKPQIMRTVVKRNSHSIVFAQYRQRKKWLAQAGPQNTRNQPGYVSDSAATEPPLIFDAELLLKQAISSWENGVKSRNKGELPKARLYFQESSRLLDQYNVQYAVLGHYIVRKLKPEDCLWRIAGYSDIYGDPFQWTRIYQRNRDQIQNPSLIYPGQRFVIPPKRDASS